MSFIRPLLILILLGISLTSFSKNFELIGHPVADPAQAKIEYSYEWVRVKDLSDSERGILNLTQVNSRLKVLKAEFKFFVEKDYRLFNNDFYSNIDALEALSGMKFNRISETKYKVSDTNLGIKVTATVETKFGVDYDLYQSTYDYIEPEAESYLMHQVSTDFNRTLVRSDIITHMTQIGDYTKVTLNSYAVMTKKDGSGLRSFPIRKFIVSKMKKQSIRAPHVYIDHVK